MTATPSPSTSPTGASTCDGADDWDDRREGWTPNPPKYTSGVLGKYAKLVQSASQGAITG